jgi:hypothetical protein
MELLLDELRRIGKKWLVPRGGTSVSIQMRVA